jgi:hypothetical protein
MTPRAPALRTPGRWRAGRGATASSRYRHCAT